MDDDMVYREITPEYLDQKRKEIWEKYKDSNWMKMLGNEGKYNYDQEMRNGNEQVRTGICE